MNYYEARELTDDQGNPTGRYKYTVMNDHRIWSVGYCADGCDGHATPEDACKHYRQYLLDNRLRLDGMTPNEQHKCEVCGAWTQRGASVDLHQWHLCDEHCTREQVEKLFGPVGTITSSY